jgi:hypothetical protein
MAISLSRRARNYLLAEGSLKTLMETADIGAGAEGFVLDVYSGSAPTNPEDAATGTLIVTVSTGGVGTTLAFEASPVTGNGAIQKLAAGDWRGTAIGAGGTMGYFRFRKISDTQAADGSFTYPRIQGAVAVAGSDLNVSSTSLTTAQILVINSFVLNLPVA